MDITKKEKDQHNMSMGYFVKLLQDPLEKIYTGSKLQLLAFGLDVSNSGEYIYFDYPYNEIVEAINEAIADNKSKFFQIDSWAYSLLTHNNNNKEIHYLACQCDYRKESEEFIISNLKSNLSAPELIGSNKRIALFIFIMYMNSNPHLILNKKDLDTIKINLIGLEVNNSSSYFLILHHKYIENSQEMLIANFCINDVNQIDINSQDNLKEAFSELSTFSKNYAGLNQNIILKKLKENQDEIISNNSKFIHTLKDKNLRYCYNPLSELNLKVEDQTLKTIFEHSKDLNEIFIRSLASFRKKDDLMLFDDIQEWLDKQKNNNPEFTISFHYINMKPETYLFQSNKLDFEILLDTLFLNALDALDKRESDPARKRNEKKIEFSVLNYQFKGRNYIKFSLTSVDTIALNMKIWGHEPINSERPKTGFGLFLVNNELKKMKAYKFQNGLFFMATRINPDSKSKGVTITFLIPLKPLI